MPALAPALYVRVLPRKMLAFCVHANQALVIAKCALVFLICFSPPLDVFGGGNLLNVLRFQVAKLMCVPCLIHWENGQMCFHVTCMSKCVQEPRYGIVDSLSGLRSFLA